MNKRKTIKDILFLCFLVILLILQIILINYNSKNTKIKVYSDIAKWYFASNNSETAIKLSEEKLYPGMNGKFKIQVDATNSEVEIEYEIVVIKEYNIPINMTFIAEILDERGGVIKKTEKYDSLLKLASENLKDTIPIEKNNQKREIVVYWNWEDSEDVFLNSDLNFSDCGFEIEIIGKQQS